MQHFQKEKITVMGVAVAHTTTAIASAVPLDIQGAGEAVIDILFQTVVTANTDGPIKLTEADTSGGSYTDVSGALFTVFPVASTDNTKIWRIHVPVAQKNLKRFLKVSILQGDAGTATVTTIGRTVALNEVPTGSPDNGAAQTIIA